MEKKIQIEILMKLARGFHLTRYKDNWLLIDTNFVQEIVEKQVIDPSFEQGLLQPIDDSSWTLSPIGWKKAETLFTQLQPWI